MSGGTRCNITHATDRRGIIDAFGRQGRFLHSALAVLGPEEVVRLIEDEGVATKVEETGKVFPVSDSAVDVRDALLRIFQRSGAQMQLGESVANVERNADEFMITTESQKFRSARVIITTGGKSYPGCGTTGDGYVWASALGHTIVEPKPALVPLTTRAAWVPSLKGLTIPDVLVEIRAATDSNSRGKWPVLAQRRSSLLFTHFGLSGPAAMDVSHAVSRHEDPRSLELICDFLPHTSPAELERAFTAELQHAGKRQLPGIVSRFVPRRLAETILELNSIPPNRRAAEVTKTERLAILQQIKRTTIPLLETLGFEKAEVTAGGVRLDEIDSRTMESKLVPGLYFAGEILDLDGPIGGYNFQAAFSTGWLAGLSSTIPGRQ
jgi:predicted Rossmann fold flavoprotein